jgi:ABC-type nickel/cobalt efflux system permease component RcnA
MMTLNAKRRKAKSLLLTTTLTLCGALAIPRATFAHPMGNFSINHYSRLIASARAIELDYIIDMAEIPTFQETQENGLVTRPGDPALVRYLAGQAELLKTRLTLQADGHQLGLECLARQAIFPPGAGGLPTMKMGFIYRALLPLSLSSAPVAVHYADGNFPGRAGWKEIIALSRPGAVLASSSVPSRDRSLELTNYPTDMLNSPPQTLEASLVFKAAPPGSESKSGALEAAAETGWLAAAGTGVRLEANRQGTPRSIFTDLIKSNRMDLSFVRMAALISAVLGGFHALEPGHGKTLVAAYLVGARGTARQAVLLGATVTASHTASVYALGIATLYASRWVVPDQLYPWLGAASGLIVSGLGCALFIGRWRRARSAGGAAHQHGVAIRHHQHLAHHHDDAHDHPYHQCEKQQEHKFAAVHEHNWWGGHARVGAPDVEHIRDYRHENAQAHHHHHIDDTPTKPLSLSGLFALGVTGGIVPCPAALVVLLAALAIHRVAFGLFLIVAFSAGLAAVLIGLGLATVFAARFMSRFTAPGPLTERWLPLASSSGIMMIGLAMCLQSLVAAGVLNIHV